MSEKNELYLAQKMLAEYSDTNTTKTATLKELDKKVKRPGMIFGYIFGICSSLVFGTGLCFALKVIGDSMLIGIIVGLVGILLMVLTYPIYSKITASKKQKYREQIITLSNEILNK